MLRHAQARNESLRELTAPSQLRVDNE